MHPCRVQIWCKKLPKCLLSASYLSGKIQQYQRGGHDRVRTDVNGFAVRCVTTPPRGRPPRAAGSRGEAGMRVSQAGDPAQRDCQSARNCTHRSRVPPRRGGRCQISRCGAPPHSRLLPRVWAQLSSSIMPLPCKTVLSFLGRLVS